MSYPDNIKKLANEWKLDFENAPFASPNTKPFINILSKIISDKNLSEQEKKAILILSEQNIKMGGDIGLEAKEIYSYFGSIKENVNPVIEKTLGNYRMPGKQYHIELPEPLKKWYVYTTDGGHSIACILKTHYNKGIKKYEDYIISVPVKAVLEDYEILENGFILVDLNYDDEIGLVVDEKYIEF